MKGLAVIAALICSIGASTSVVARTIEIPEYDKLFAKSDLVVIARPVTKTRDTKERRNLLSNGLPTVSSTGVVTEFESLLVLKGYVGRTRFLFHHYRINSSREKVIIDPPGFVTFGVQPTQHPFLLFLIRESDGRFAPAAGQFDPMEISVQQLSSLM